MATYLNDFNRLALKAMLGEGLDVEGLVQADRITSGSYDWDKVVTIAKLGALGTWLDQVVPLTTGNVIATYKNESSETVNYPARSPVFRPSNQVTPSAPQTDGLGVIIPVNSQAISWNFVGVGSEHEGVTGLGLVRSHKADDLVQIVSTLQVIGSATPVDLYSKVLTVQIGTLANNGIKGYFNMYGGFTAYMRDVFYKLCFARGADSVDSLLPFSCIAPAWNKIYSAKEMELDSEIEMYTIWNMNTETPPTKTTIRAMPEGITIYKVFLYKTYNPTTGTYVLCEAANYPRPPQGVNMRAAVFPTGEVVGVDPENLWNGTDDGWSYYTDAYKWFLRCPTVFFSLNGSSGFMDNEVPLSLAINQFFSTANGRGGHPVGGGQLTTEEWTYKYVVVARYEMRAARWNEEEGYYQSVYWKFMGDVAVMELPVENTIASGSLVNLPAGTLKIGLL